MYKRQLAAVRGTYEFQGSRFDIARGSLLRFRGDDMTNPTLDIIAEREIAGVDVTVRIRGTAAEPILTLASQPPLDQADICLLYTSDAADERSSVDLGGRRIIKKKTQDKRSNEQPTINHTEDS